MVQGCMTMRSDNMTKYPDKPTVVTRTVSYLMGDGGSKELQEWLDYIQKASLGPIPEDTHLGFDLPEGCGTVGDDDMFIGDEGFAYLDIGDGDHIGVLTIAPGEPVSLTSVEYNGVRYLVARMDGCGDLPLVAYSIREWDGEGVKDIELFRELIELVEGDMDRTEAMLTPVDK